VKFLAPKIGVFKTGPKKQLAPKIGDLKQDLRNKWLQK
jgi:hypothetical protein